MDSLDAQCFLIAATEAKGCTPTQWCHEACGRLRLRFADSPNDYSWDGAGVAEIAARWHAEQPLEIPAPVTRLIDAHRRFMEIVVLGELEPPDRVFHDLERLEVRAVWDDARLHVVVDVDDPEASLGELAHRDAA